MQVTPRSQLVRGRPKCEAGGTPGAAAARGTTAPLMARKHGDEGPKTTTPTLGHVPTQAELLDRAAGAIVGACVGEALAMGVHWQYDLATLQADRGWVSDYTTPLPDTYHAGCLTAGQTTLPGAITHELLASLASRRGLDQDDFHERFDSLLRSPGMDGTRTGGRWGWTDKVYCELWRARVEEGRPWSECFAPRSDDTATIVRAALIGARYHASPTTMCEAATLHAEAQTHDTGVVANSAAFASLVGGAIQGVPLLELSEVMYGQADAGVLPFSILKGHRDAEGESQDIARPFSLGKTALWAKQLQLYHGQASRRSR
jgi:ADP-ribosylglycohydrolase